MTLPGFEAPTEPKPLSRDAARTKRNNDAIAAGRHPFGAPLANNGKTCGQCWYAFAKDHGRKRFWKCERGKLTDGAATDLRLSWPACTLYRADADPESDVPGWVTRAVAP